MRDDQPEGVPQLREETRAARGRTLELVLSVVVLSTLLSMAVNLGSALLLQVLTSQQILLVVCLCAAVTLLILVALVPRISTTIKEFHEEIELLLPLRVSERDVEGFTLSYYSQLDVIADALRRFPPETRQELASNLLATAHKNADAFRAVTRFSLEAAQFLLAVELVKRSRQLLGDAAEFHKSRAVARLQTGMTKGDWQHLAEQAAGNPFFTVQAQGVPQNVLLPAGVRVRVPDLDEQLKSATRRSRATAAEDITLLSLAAGRDVVLRITAVVGHSEHGLPTRGVPRRGLTARAVLRNAEDRHLRELARREEVAAEQLESEQDGPDASVEPAGEASEEAIQRERAHQEAYTKLYRGTRQPRLLRVFVRFDGAFRIRLLSGERRQRGLYAWGAALSRLLARTDIEVFMATLKDLGQKTPNRTF